MPIVYTAATNIIVVTGYAAILPCNFTDLYNADKAGTYSLHARVGIAGVDGAGVAVTNALRPTDYVVLGGASGDLYITIANWNLMTNATIDVIGTDRDGNPQTDSIAVVGNGNYNTALWFATVTQTQVTVFNTPGGGTFDYDLIQGQWGVIWRTGDAFQLDCFTHIGDNVIETWFADTKKSVTFTNGPNDCFRVRGNGPGHAWIGTLDDAATHATSAGCVFIFTYTFAGLSTPVNNWGDMTFYSSTALVKQATAVNFWIQFYAVNCMAWNSIFSGFSIPGNVGVDFYNCYITNAYRALYPSSGVFNRIIITDSGHGIGTYEPLNLDVSNTIIQRTSGANFRFFRPVVATLQVVDCAADLWDITWFGPSTAFFNRRYTFNLRVVDATGTGIVGATVNMDDRFGANVFNVVTGAGGDIVEQTVTYGYYDLANGNNMQPAGGGYSPHTVTISLAGYAPRSIVYTIDRPHVEVEKLGGAAPHGMEYRRRRVPGEVSALYEYE